MHLEVEGALNFVALIGLSQTTESPWMSGTIEHLRASTMMAKNLRARKSEIRDAYQALSNRKAS